MRPTLDAVLPFYNRKCAKCGKEQDATNYLRSKSIFMDGYAPICNSCIKAHLEEHDWEWDEVDKILQLLDIPFIPREFERLREQRGDDVLTIYTEIFFSEEYASLDWAVYNNEFIRLREEGLLENEIPLVDKQKFEALKRKWGGDYLNNQLLYLENLYKGLLAHQNISGNLQIDQAQKVCKLSLAIDMAINEGAQVDKLLSSYEKLVKIADFTPKNVRSAGDFETFGEVAMWLEKRGWVNKFYDDVTRDIVDETMKNIQAFNQRLYTDETGIGEDTTRRVEALKTLQQAEASDDYGTGLSYNLDEYENEGFDALWEGEESEVFEEFTPAQEEDF